MVFENVKIGRLYLVFREVFGDKLDIGLVVGKQNGHSNFNITSEIVGEQVKILVNSELITYPCNWILKEATLENIKTVCEYNQQR